MHRENNHALATATTITASMLYDFVHCPHRVWMDLFADQTKRDEASPFVQLLWERGAAHENDVVAGISGTFVDLSHYRGDEKERQTLAAMDRGSDLIYSGRISSGDLLGEPDLLRRDGTGYVAGDIKSGAGAEGATDESEGKPKKHYAVQLALYTDVLERLARSPGRRAFVWDIHGKELLYDFAAEDGTGKSQRLWDYYQECLGEARAIISKTKKTLPAYASGICTNCLWYTACINTLETANDLTLIPELGRSKRDAMIDRVHSIRELAETSVDRFINGQKTVFPGIGPATLAKFHARAQLLTTRGKPYLRAPVVIPSAKSIRCAIFATCTASSNATPVIMPRSDLYLSLLRTHHRRLRNELLQTLFATSQLPSLAWSIITLNMNARFTGCSARNILMSVPKPKLRPFLTQ